MDRRAECSKAGEQLRSIVPYEPPRVERTLSQADLRGDVLYAGPVDATGLPG